MCQPEYNYFWEGTGLLGKVAVLTDDFKRETIPIRLVGISPKAVLVLQYKELEYFAKKAHNNAILGSDGQS